MIAKDVIEYFKLCKSSVEACNEALGVAVEALEKQIPKKLTVSEEIYCCPRCGENAAILQGDNYCFNCGQALDWSDTE